MKRILFVLATLACTTLTAQQKTEVSVASKLTNATVYYGYGAELNHTAKATLRAGSQEVVIDNIATQLDQNSIRVGCPENVVLMSTRFNVKTNVPASTAKNPLIEKMQDTIKQLNKQITAINDKAATTEDILNRTARLIESNLNNNPKRDINSSELIKLADYYAAQVKVLKTTMFELQVRKTELNETIAAINNRITLISQQENPYTPAHPAGQIILQVMTKSATPAEFTISYFTNNAGWIPTYDMRVKTLDNSFTIAYKASVTQNTGIDWKDVKLSLTTSNPNVGGTVPEMSPWFLNLYVPVLYKQMMNAPAKAMATRNAGQVIVDEARDYKQKDLEDKTVDISNVGAYTSISESRLNTTFDIDLPYDIPADGKAYSVAIKHEQVRANYQHYAVPKYDRDAFLIAELTDWEKLDLLPGEASIILDNIYIGKSFIDPNTTTDTLSLSLGRDKRVAIKRVLVKDHTKSRIKADNKVETFTYDITLRNNKKEALDIIVKDQYPVSMIKEVEVTLDNSSGAEVNKETGSLNWTMKLQPGENRTVRFSYTVKYPKDKVIQNLR